MRCKIQKLSNNDVALAKELFVFFQEDDGDPVIHVPDTQYLNGLLSRSDFHVLVATVDGNIAGGLTAYELPMYKEMVNEIFLYEIGVGEAYRRRGIARALIEELKKICREKNIREFYVGAMADNEPAVKLYTASGGKYEAVAWFTYDVE